MIGAVANATNRGIARLRAEREAEIRRDELVRLASEKRSLADQAWADFSYLYREKVRAWTVPIAKTYRVTSKAIIADVCRSHEVTKAELIGPARTRRFVAARQECYYRIHNEMGWSLPQIGRAIGDRDHTTVLHGIRQYKARIEAGEVSA